MPIESKVHTVLLRQCVQDPDMTVQCLKIGFPVSQDLAVRMAEATNHVLPSTKGRIFIEEDGVPATMPYPTCERCRAAGVIFQRIEEGT